MLSSLFTSRSLYITVLFNLIFFCFGSTVIFSVLWILITWPARKMSHLVYFKLKRCFTISMKNMGLSIYVSLSIMTSLLFSFFISLCLHFHSNSVPSHSVPYFSWFLKFTVPFSSQCLIYLFSFRAKKQADYFFYVGTRKRCSFLWTF